MTEDEAKTKWCPMTRFHRGLDEDVYCNKPIGNVTSPDSTFCIASACMMWIEEHKCGGTTWLGGCGLKVRS